ncbi:cysteine dioxygenase family protein [Paraburkholderia lycopersici]|uniref:Cysteine dioxygenase type I n=1 Tax=Paraburkholderia lycopersici TaxID=416944 RepID=A0A1G6LBB3_9BURK|nr:cysteine dioxygenase family protein [Paraburkholderia lycopersici]SDC40458.1 Cysteine dioxygenase type I [Paraburkholderia lycopersici]
MYLSEPEEQYAMNAPAELAHPSAVHTAEQHAAAVARLTAALDTAFETCATPADPSQCARFARGMRAALTRALADPALVTSAQREGSARTYRRHVIASDRSGRYTVAALVWQPGHASPVHAHHTWCGYAVLEGALTETLYAWNDAHQGAHAVRSHPRASGAVSFGGRGRANIHRLYNGSAAQAVSLHVYGVPAEDIAAQVNDMLPLARETAQAAR